LLVLVSAQRIAVQSGQLATVSNFLTSPSLNLPGLDNALFLRTC